MLRSAQFTVKKYAPSIVGLRYAVIRFWLHRLRWIASQSMRFVPHRLLGGLFSLGVAQDGAVTVGSDTDGDDHRDVAFVAAPMVWFGMSEESAPRKADEKCWTSQELEK